MSFFDSVMKDFPLALQKLINDRLNEWSLKNPFGQRVARNIHLEHFLCEDSMKKLLSFIGNFVPTDPLHPWKEFEAQYQQECYKHALLGGKIQVSYSPILFGTSVEKEAFVLHLKKKYKRYLVNENVRNDFIYRLKKGLISPSFLHFRLKEYSVWSTWNAEDINGHPYAFCNTDHANEVRACMGLRVDDAKSALLIFNYTLPSHIIAQRATIADAELSEYFEPPLEGIESHSTTVTWKFLGKYKKLGYHLDPRPECIHQSVTFDDIKLPIDIKK